MDERSSFPWLSVIYVVLILVVTAGLIYWQISIRTDEGIDRKTIISDLFDSQRGVTATQEVLATGSLARDPLPTPAFSPLSVPAVVATPPPEPQAPLPRLQESDMALREKLASMVGGAELLALLSRDELIRKGVRMVYGLSEGFLVKEFRPLESPTGRYLVVPTGEKNAEGAPYYLRSEQNDARYARYVGLLSKIKPESAYRIYRHFYPLMQQAYEELGLREASFERVVSKAIDVMLVPASGANSEPRLRQPSVMYVFDNDDIESSSGVNKLKLRLGEETNIELEAWLREFKTLL